MPRKHTKWFVKVGESLRLQPGVWYVMLVVSVARSVKPQAIRIVLEHLNAEHTGRRHDVLLSVQPRVGGGLTGMFFEACGLDLAVGQEIAPEDVIGRRVRARFTPDEADTPPEIVAFQSLPAAPKERTRKSPDPATPDVPPGHSVAD